MADSQTSEEMLCSESADLRTEIISVAFKRLSTICQESGRQQVAKVLDKRKRKWRKRHKFESHDLDYQPLDPQLREDKESLGGSLEELKEVLVRRRRQGLATARQLQNEEGVRCLESICHRLQNVQRWLQTYKASTLAADAAGFSSERTEQLVHAELADQGKIIQDLESAISQVWALSEIQKMKLYMTPRVPPLHDRTLSGNLLDSSLGVFHEGILVNHGASAAHAVSVITSSTSDDILPEVLDSEHAQLQIIGKVVSISQEESIECEVNGMLTDNPSDHCIEVSTTVSKGTDTTLDAPVEMSPMKHFETNDDTPGIGMEVVCVGGSESDTSVVAQSLGTSSSSTSQNENLNINNHNDVSPEFYLPPYPHPLATTVHVTPAQELKRRQRLGNSSHDEDDDDDDDDEMELDVIDNSTDNENETDSQLSKLLRAIEKAPYELRIPVRERNTINIAYGTPQYYIPTKRRTPKSTQRGRPPKSAKKQPKTPKTVPPTQSNNATPDSTTPGKRKRGRPRKNPISE